MMYGFEVKIKTTYPSPNLWTSRRNLVLRFDARCLLAFIIIKQSTEP